MDVLGAATRGRCTASAVLGRLRVEGANAPAPTASAKMETLRIVGLLLPAAPLGDQRALRTLFFVSCKEVRHSVAGNSKHAGGGQKRLEEP